MKRYPIAEMFDSVQGEGALSGTPMTFIRLAGCCVGRWTPTSPAPYETCTIWDGREFTCDTDYRVTERLTVEEILARVPRNAVWCSLTGGEPLMYDVAPLVNALRGNGYKVSVDTSGVRPVPDGLFDWLVVSPKYGMLETNLRAANEVRLLVDAKFNETEAARLEQLTTGYVSVSPVNAAETLDRENMERCLDLLKRHPTWRLNLQAHKIWNVR